MTGVRRQGKPQPEERSTVQSVDAQLKSLGMYEQDMAYEEKLQVLECVKQSKLEYKTRDVEDEEPGLVKEEQENCSDASDCTPDLVDVVTSSRESYNTRKRSVEDAENQSPKKERCYQQRVGNSPKIQVSSSTELQDKDIYDFDANEKLLSPPQNNKQKSAIPSNITSEESISPAIWTKSLRRKVAGATQKKTETVTSTKSETIDNEVKFVGTSRNCKKEEDEEEDSPLDSEEVSSIWMPEAARQRILWRADQISGPSPYAPPKGVSMKQHSKTVLAHFNNYFKLLRVAQDNMTDRASWGRPIVVGRTHPNTLDAVRRNRTSLEDDDRKEDYYKGRLRETAVKRSYDENEAQWLIMGDESDEDFSQVKVKPAQKKTYNRKKRQNPESKPDDNTQTLNEQEIIAEVSSSDDKVEHSSPVEQVRRFSTSNVPTSLRKPLQTSLPSSSESATPTTNQENSIKETSLQEEFDSLQKVITITDAIHNTPQKRKSNDVECPVCLESYPSNEIEAHASNCYKSPVKSLVTRSKKRNVAQNSSQSECIFCERTFDSGFELNFHVRECSALRKTNENLLLDSSTGTANVTPGATSDDKDAEFSDDIVTTLKGQTKRPRGRTRKT